MRTNAITYIPYKDRIQTKVIPPCQLKKDTVNFEGKLSLTSKYGIDVKKVIINKTDNVGEISKDLIKTLIEKILEGHEHARKNMLSKNIANSAYATNIGTSTGQWGLASNFNNTRDEISAVCGERSAILVAYNKFLHAIRLNKKIKQPEFSVDYIAMSSYKEVGSDHFAIYPCADCLSWFNTTRYFHDTTIIAGLKKNDNNYHLILRTLKDYLPLRNEKTSILKDNETIKDLFFEATKHARGIMVERNITKEQLEQLFLKAKADYDITAPAEAMKCNLSAGILDVNNRITTGRKQSWTTRWFTEPAEFALAKLLEQQPNIKQLNALAYYGDSNNNSVVNIKTLGLLLSKFEDPNILIITQVDNKLKIRTINDYLPQEYGYIPSYKRKK